MTVKAALKLLSPVVMHTPAGYPEYRQELNNVWNLR
jgi:hypothetical protein